MRILVDTSVWVDHLRYGNASLQGLLDENSVIVHPFVTGELACGHLRNRSAILGLLEDLNPAPMAEHGEALRLLTEHQLGGRGIGWVDVHLLASALLGAAFLWTFDKSLQAAARTLRVATGSR